MKKIFVTTSIGLLFAFISTAQAMMGEQRGAPPAPVQGPSTIDSVEKIGTQGNWVKKRDWLIKAHEVQSEIDNLVIQAEQTRKSFIDKHNEIDDTLDDYYKRVGLEEGKVGELFENINRYLEKKKKKEITSFGLPEGEKPDPDLQTKVEIIEKSINVSKQQLEQLKLDMKSIEDLGRSLIDRIKRVDEHMDIIQEETDKAKNIINDLWNIIDHNKARDRYYELKMTILEKIKASQSYLQDDLLKDFDTVIGTITKQIAITQEQIKKVESDGFFIKDRAQRVKELKLQELDAKQKEAALKAQLPSPQPAQPKKQLTWYEKLYQRFISFMADIYTFIAKFVAPAPTTSTKIKLDKLVAQPVPPSPSIPASPIVSAQTNIPSPQPETPVMPALPPVIPTTQQAAPVMPPQ